MSDHEQTRQAERRAVERAIWRSYPVPLNEQDTMRMADAAITTLAELRRPAVLAAVEAYQDAWQAVSDAKEVWWGDRTDENLSTLDEAFRRRHTTKIDLLRAAGIPDGEEAGNG